MTLLLSLSSINANTKIDKSTNINTDTNINANTVTNTGECRPAHNNPRPQLFILSSNVFVVVGNSNSKSNSKTMVNWTISPQNANKQGAIMQQLLPKNR